MSITYEWVVECLNDEDIIEVRHESNYAAAVAVTPKDGTPYQIALVRDRHNNIDEDLEDRAWAYIEDGRLLETFDNGIAVPKKYRDEVVRFHATKEK
jgi:hypothetical protein